MPMGEAVEPVMTAMGIRSLRVDRPEDVIPTTSAALTQTFNRTSDRMYCSLKNCLAPKRSEGR